MNGRRTTIVPLKKLEATLRRDAAFVAWRYGRETRFASWEFPTGKSMRRSTTSRFAPHRTEAIPCERRSGIFVDSSSDSAPCSRGSLWPHRILPFFTRPSRDRKAVADRKSTRLNSSHVSISYAVFCLKKKKKKNNQNNY